MTGGQLFTLFLIAALFAPPALYLVIVFGERQAPALHRWYLRHARGINWSLATMFAILTVVTLLRPDTADPLDSFEQGLNRQLPRVFVLALFALNTVDHAMRALRAGRQAAT